MGLNSPVNLLLFRIPILAVFASVFCLFLAVFGSVFCLFRTAFGLLPGPSYPPIFNQHGCDEHIVFYTQHMVVHHITSRHVTLSDVHHMCSTSHAMKHHITNHITSHPIASRTTSRVLASHHMASGFWGLRLRVDSTSHFITSHCRCASQALHSYHITSHIASLASAHHITSAHQMSSQLTYEFTSTHHTY